MSHVISDIKSHEASIARANANRDRILSDPCWENSESGLSLWAADANNVFDRAAIDWLKLGEAAGFNGPGAEVRVLMKGDVIVEARLFSKEFYGNWKWSWAIQNDGLVEMLGRRFIPEGENSRIQKQLGLHEDRAVLPIKPFVNAHCAFVGAAMSFSPVIDWDKAREVRDIL